MKMVKRKEFLYDQERERMKQMQEPLGMKVENYEEAWEEGLFESRTGMTNKQSMDAPYKFHGRWEWWEGDNFTYGYRKKTWNSRKRKNAKSRKPKTKKYYRKARSKRVFKEDVIPVHVELWRQERDEHTEYMISLGRMASCKCKGCDYPLAFKYMDNHDMALCHDCAEGLRDEKLVNKMGGE